MDYIKILSSMYYKSIKKLTKKLLDMLLPNHCLICNSLIVENEKSPKTICINCIKTKLDYVTASPYIFCKKCGSILEKECNECKCSLRNDKYYDNTNSMLFYNNNASKIIHSIKFEHKYKLCEDISLLISDIHKNYILKNDYIIPVPIGKKRLKLRGYNQSYIIANTIYKKLEINVINDLIERQVETKALSSTKSKEERNSIIKNAFKVNKSYIEKLENKHLLIVDDVFTTGTTVNEMSKTLTYTEKALPLPRFRIKVLT